MNNKKIFFIDFTTIELFFIFLKIFWTFLHIFFELLEIAEHGSNYLLSRKTGKLMKSIANNRIIRKHLDTFKKIFGVQSS